MQRAHIGHITTCLLISAVGSSPYGTGATGGVSTPQCWSIRAPGYHPATRPACNQSMKPNTHTFNAAGVGVGHRTSVDRESPCGPGPPPAD
jgi:hypothetical protein